MDVQYIYENGYYIPFLYPVVYSLIQNHLLTTTIILKLIVINFYLQFGHLYDYSNYCPTIVKPFARLTDIGYIITFVHYFNPVIFPIAFNIHFMLSIAYLFGKHVLHFNDMETSYYDNIDYKYIEIWSNAIHILPFSFFCYMLFSNKYKFTYNTFLYSFFLVLAWLSFIYIPYRIVTGDCIYSILEYEKPRLIQLVVMLLIILLLYIGNIIGDNIYKYNS
jgi:hypothetical protein